MLVRMVIYLILNFVALGVGSMFTTGGVESDWYASLDKAPWTPPDWMFGAAWTTIMICFAIYMSYAWEIAENRSFLMAVFGVQWLLNVLWNPVFFKYHLIFPALILILLLTVVVGYFVFAYWSQLKYVSLLVLPYFIWLLIATSLNAYILVRN